MGVADQITQMREKGFSDEEISNKLQEQRVPPASINDAFNRLRVKEAVSADNNLPPSQNTYQTKMPSQDQFYTPRTKDISQPQQEEFQLEEQQPAGQGEYYAPTPEQASQQQYYPQYGYSDYPDQAMTSTATGTDTMIEIAEQVFSEKTKEFQKQMETLTEFATLAENKIESNTKRLERIEKIIDNLQIKILEKVGSYGDNLDKVKKEMNMMQDSFSKVLPELTEAHKKEHKK